ncbi:DUF4870 domain-containing protein [Actinomadura sp. 6K520]|uniref:DUF4870 domain-containing protein n=1 Tax=Actinomadura sp. 6K520 TaxID=2530364 RepID=UPI00104F54A6|nr:DUF4870 domain-containing protein [Actinomadura sp. 6K520]TDE39356.1 DUF4870 domain-containing protein [Actinomadura sp. 6K520]
MTDHPPPPPGQPPPYSGPYGNAPGQPPYGGPPPGSPPGQPPYGSPPGGGHYDQPPGGGHYDQPPGGGHYGQPPGGPYDPHYGYGPPPPQGPAQAEDSTWAIFAYVGNLLIGFLPALIIYLVKKNTSPLTRFHAAQSMNYQLTLLIHLLVVVAVCVPPAIVFDTPLFLIALAVPYLELLIAGWWLLILGAIKAGKQQYYRFPTFFCFRMIR